VSASSNPIRVLVVDDHAMLREGVAAMMATESDMELAGQAADGVEAIAAFERLRPDIVLLDLQMPRMKGLDVLAALRQLEPAARVIVLTTYDGDVQALRALKAGASGYLLKTSLRKELIDAVRAVHAGRRYILAEVAHDIALHATEDSLSQREIDILEQVARGQSNKAVARGFGLSEDTIKAHLRSVFSKLHVRDRTEAVTVALKRGILTL
jgi:DNA-binding NarL/FixJ family response regulator